MAKKKIAQAAEQVIRAHAVEAIAPTRIDLAGGTVDIWPLYLFHDNAMTVNVAIDLFAKVKVRARNDKKIKFLSKDQQVSFETDLSFRGLERTPLEFLVRIAKFYAPEQGLTIFSNSSSPAGAGLGGSSALAVALSSAFNSYLKRKFSRRSQIFAIKNIETRILRVPTGEQDYYSAFLGGINALCYGISGTLVKRLLVNVKELESRLILCFTGKERSSSLSNWDMVKRYLDGSAKAKNAMNQICNAAESMAHTLQKQDFDTAGEILNEEWENRKRLSPKVTNEKIDKFMKVASSAGVIGGKVCGAGGGGCIVFLSEKGKKKDVEQKLSEAGGKILKFKICSKGVKSYEV